MAEYRILPGSSEVHVHAKSSLHAIDGAAVDITGAVETDVVGGTPGRTLRGRVEVPLRGLRSGNPLNDAELKRRVDARRYPTIVGEVRTATALGNDGLFRVEGDVTFHGVTRPVTGDIQVRAEGDRLILEGEHVFDIREFGIKPPRILMLRVEPDVTVRIRLVAEPA
jgi:polyisoprenoid-binding protein YceI